MQPHDALTSPLHSARKNLVSPCIRLSRYLHRSRNQDFKMNGSRLRQNGIRRQRDDQLRQGQVHRLGAFGTAFGEGEDILLDIFRIGIA